jgi:hypothetical protein
LLFDLVLYCITIIDSHNYSVSLRSLQMHRRAVLLLNLTAALARRQYCTASCRSRASARVPTFTLPRNDSLSKAVALSQCQKRTFATPACLRTLWRVPGAGRDPVRPQLIISVSTIPPRAHLLGRMLARMRLQTRRPDRLLVSVPSVFRRFPNATVNVSALRSAFISDQEMASAGSRTAGRLQFLLGRCDDTGPGTKLLCPLPMLLAEQAAPHGRHGAKGARTPWVVLVDDDVVYKEWALAVLERAIMNHSTGCGAFSFDTFTLNNEGRQVVAGSAEGLHVGQGHAMFALRLDALQAARAVAAGERGARDLASFYRCLLGAEPRAFFHDDVWISWWLSNRTSVHAGRVCKIAVPGHMGDVHYKTASFKSPGALVTRTDDEHKTGVPAPAAAAADTVSPPESRNYGKGQHTQREWLDAGRTRRLLNEAMATLRARVESGQVSC